MKLSFKILIGVISVLTFIIIVLIINHYTISCKGSDLYDESLKLCYYYAPNGIVDCEAGMKYGNNNCYYKKTGLLSGNVLLATIILLSLSSLSFIIYTIVKRKKGMMLISEAILREELDFYSEVKPAFEEFWCREYNIPTVNNIPPKDTFIYTDREPFVDRQSGRKFIQVEMQCFTARKPDGNGIFTLTLPLDKEKKEDLKRAIWNNIRFKNTRFDKYRVTASRPLAIAKSKEDLMRSILQATAESPEEFLQKIQSQKDLLSSFGLGEMPIDIEKTRQPMQQPEEIEALDPYERVKYEEDLRLGRKVPTYKKPRR